MSDAEDELEMLDLRELGASPGNVLPSRAGRCNLSLCWPLLRAEHAAQGAGDTSCGRPGLVRTLRRDRRRTATSPARTDGQLLFCGKTRATGPQSSR